MHPRLYIPDYTGNSAFLLPPANVSNACLIYGPTTGIFPANWPIVIRKSPNRINKPYSSMTNPVRGQRKRINDTPTRKATVPFIFWRRVKKAIVLLRPMIRLSPIRKRIYFVSLLRFGWSGGRVGKTDESYISHCESIKQKHPC